MLGELGIILLVFISAFLLGMATARIKLKSKLEGLSEELDVKNVVIEKLDNDLQIAQMKISQLEKELSGSITQAVYEELKSIHQKELNKIDKWLQEQKTQIKTLHKQLEEADQLRLDLEEKYENQKEAFNELTDKLTSVEGRMHVAEAKLATSYQEELELPNLQEVIFEREQEIAELRGKIEELEDIISDENLSQDYGTKNMAIFQRLETQLGQLNETSTSDEELAEKPAKLSEEDLSTKASNDPNFPREKLAIDVVNAPYAKEIDDLTQLKGIGDYTALKLNAIGIQNFRQISNLTDEDIKKVNKAIKFFPGRIARDKWVEQAKEKLKDQHD